MEARSTPLNRTNPSSEDSNPAIIRNKVDLPLPDAPNKQTVSPELTVNEMPLSKTWPSYVLEILLSSSKAIVISFNKQNTDTGNDHQNRGHCHGLTIIESTWLREKARDGHRDGGTVGSG